ncbi:MAG: 50S ribosomal protein L10 [Nanoarchaeota archaeon]|nr:50S ribosomal protein L10 [Nanoarchaeota archaeon]
MELENYNPKINARNQDFAKRIRDFAQKYSIIGILDVEGLPAPQFQRIRASIKKDAEVLIVKKNLISIVCQELETKFPTISELNNYSNGVVGLIFTNANPFTLFKTVQKNKSSAPAKPGSIAPKDVIVPAGPTGFAPGPIIGELGALKIKAGINAGKVEIKEDSVAVKEGNVISPKLAEILTRLGIEPMEVGLNIKAIYEEGTIYDRGVLEVDEGAIIADIANEAARAHFLSIGLEYYTIENITHFISTAGRDSLGLGVGVAYPAAETINLLLSKANSQMAGVASTLPSELQPAGLVIAQPVASQANEGTTQSSSPEETPKEEQKDSSAGLADLF